jgi:RNA polymerase sigma factor (sigma-70 family)
MELSFSQIVAAQANDLLATAAVIAATESRVESLAGKAANRMSKSGASFAEYREEFAQVARIAVWESLGRFTGDSVDTFFRFVYTTVEGTLLDAVRAERDQAPGVDMNAAKTFAAMIHAAEGDVYEAERLAQVIPPKGRRLSPALANAARLAWQGTTSIDTPVSVGENTTTLADTLAVEDDAPEVVRPKVGRGAVLEALSVLERHVRVPRGTEEREALFKALEGALTGFVTPDQVDAIAEAVTVPAEPTERRYILDAVAILHSAGSTAADGALADDLRDVSDDRMAESREKHYAVNDCIDSLPRLQRDVLRHSFGIGDVLDFGWGDGCDLEGLAAYLGTTPGSAKVSRVKARKTFGIRYAATVALTNPEKGEALDQAATASRAPGGRK